MSESRRRPSARVRAAKGASLPASRRRNAALVSSAFALVALGSATALGGSALRSSLAAAVTDTRDLIAERSPGLRTRADMSKGKPRLAEARTARALPRTVDARPPVAAPLPAPAEAIAAPLVAPGTGAPGVIIPGEGAPGGVAVPAGGGPFLFAPVPGPAIIGGGGGIVIGSPAPEATPAPPVVQPPPIPEPAQWAMMILGFGVVGAATRRRRHGHAAA
jgi:hypothetical protein